MAKLNYVELPAHDLAASKDFYSKVFGFTLRDFGSAYAATIAEETNIGLAGHDAPAAPLPVIAVEDLEAVFDAVQNAGCIITKPIFSFPGGRRFHFRDPSGNELAAWVETD